MAPSHYLNQWWPSSLMSYCITWPEWVNIHAEFIIWPNAGILLIGPLETNFSEISIKIHTFSLIKNRLKIPSVNWWPFCLVLIVVTKRKNNSLAALATVPDGCVRWSHWLVDCKSIFFICQSVSEFLRWVEVPHFCKYHPEKNIKVLKCPEHSFSNFSNNHGFKWVSVTRLGLGHEIMVCFVCLAMFSLLCNDQRTFHQLPSNL